MVELRWHTGAETVKPLDGSGSTGRGAGLALRDSGTTRRGVLTRRERGGRETQEEEAGKGPPETKAIPSLVSEINSSTPGSSGISITEGTAGEDGKSGTQSGRGESSSNTAAESIKEGVAGRAGAIGKTIEGSDIREQRARKRIKKHT